MTKPNVRTTPNQAFIHWHQRLWIKFVRPGRAFHQTPLRPGPGREELRSSQTSEDTCYRPGQRGITLTELLVVIAIICTLAALLVPAVQGARETARCLACKNNLKQLGAAMLSHLQANEAFPAGGIPCPTGNAYGHSWWVPLLPFLEQRTLFDQLDKTGKESGTQYQSTGYVNHSDSVYNARNKDVLNNVMLSVGKCPSSVFPSLSGYWGPGNAIFLSDYVGIAGSSDHRTAFSTTKYTAGIVSLGGLLIPNRFVKPAQAKDGLSNTLLLGEQSDYCSLANGDRADCRSSCFSGFTMGIRTGFPTDPRIFNLTTVRYAVSKDASLANSGGNCGANSPLQAAHYAGPNALFGDGSVRLVDETTAVSVLKFLADRDDGNVIAIE